METEQTNSFEIFSKIDLTNKTKQKNGLNYLPWASAFLEVLKVDPKARFEYKPMKLDDLGNIRFWHDDGHSGWVETFVTVFGETKSMVLSIMDFKNKAIPVENITSVEANKALMRCFVKTCALHGLGLYLYEGEDLPEEVIEAQRLQKECMATAKKRSGLSEKANNEVAKLCKEAQAEYTGLTPEEVAGNPTEIDDVAILKKLKTKLLAVRK